MSRPMYHGRLPGEGESNSSTAVAAPSREAEAAGVEELANLRAAARAAANSIFVSMLGAGGALGSSPPSPGCETEPGRTEGAPAAPLNVASLNALAVAASLVASSEADQSDALVLQQARDMLSESALDMMRGIASAAKLGGKPPLKLVPPAFARGARTSSVPIGAQLMAAAQLRQQAAAEPAPQLEAQETGEVADPQQQAAGQIYMLAQLAEESAQMAASAAACCASSEADPAQATALAQAAQEAGQRAAWASSTMDSCFPTDDCLGADHLEWTANLRQIVKQAAESAEHAARNCRLQASEITSKMPVLTADKRSRVPCKWFLGGSCRKGSACEFSHDLVDMQPRPLQKKRAELCLYFQRAQCTRGSACPFAHGDEELAEVSRIVSDLKTEKRLFTRPFGRG